MAQLLGNVAVGSIVKIKENGVAQNYIIVNQGLPSSMYDSSCNGTWLFKQNYWSSSTWNPYGETSNDFQDNRPFQLLNRNFLNILDSNIRSTILNVKIPYKPYYNSPVSTGSNGYSCKAFLLSGYEMGITGMADPGVGGIESLPQDGAILSYFQGTDPSGSDEKRAIGESYWTRSLETNDSSVFIVTSVGGVYTSRADKGEYIRPALVMPSNILVDSSNNVTSYSIPSVTFLSVPSLGMVDQTITIEWSSISVSDFTINYQLQRNINNEGWQNVGSPISATSYTDTAQIGWTQVQYRVAPIVEEAFGEYTQSDIIPITNPSSLVISGQDGNLGTLTSNIPYTVSSNTGNPISLTRTVNNVQVTTLTVESGFAYSIPVADLPTGTGTIVITASVQSGLETVTQTRTWTYYKTPINIPSTGGIAQLTQNGQNIWPTTIADAVQVPVYLGGNLNAALNKLGQAALYTKIGQPKYNEAKVDLSKVSVGDEVFLNESGRAIPFIVSSLNYEPTLNTSGNRVLLVRKNCYNFQGWNLNNTNAYANSTIDNWFNTTYKSLLDSDIQNVIGETNFYYTPGNGNFSVTTLQRSVFALSLTEFGLNYVDANIEGTTLSNNNQLKIAFLDNRSVSQWTRSPVTASNVQYAMAVSIEGTELPASITTYSNIYARPCFTLPNTFTATYYIDTGNNIYPSQEYTQGGSITDVFGYDIPIAQTEVGTYVGTGQYGSSNPNSISLSFTPKFVCVTNQSQPWIGGIIPYLGHGIMWMGDTSGSTTPTTGEVSGIWGLAANWQGNSVSWYNLNGYQYQLNQSGNTYQYVAFG